MERVLYPKRRLGRLVLFIFLWLVLIPMSSRTRHFSSGMITFVCAVGVITSALSLVPGATWLKLDSQGFTVRKWFREDTYRWADIKDFRLITYRYMGIIPFRRSVGFTLSGKRNVVMRVAGALARFDRLLPDNFGMKPRDLMALLELCRREAVAAVADPYAPPPAIEPEQEVYRRYLQGEIEMRKLSEPQMNETAPSSATASAQNLPIAQPLGTERPSGSQPLSPLGQIISLPRLFCNSNGCLPGGTLFLLSSKVGET